MEMGKSIVSIFVSEIAILLVLNLRYYIFCLFSKKDIENDMNKIRKKCNKYLIIRTLLVFEFLGLFLLVGFYPENDFNLIIGIISFIIGPVLN